MIYGRAFHCVQVHTETSRGVKGALTASVSCVCAWHGASLGHAKVHVQTGGSFLMIHFFRRFRRCRQQPQPRLSTVLFRSVLFFQCRCVWVVNMHDGGLKSMNCSRCTHIDRWAVTNCSFFAFSSSNTGVGSAEAFRGGTVLEVFRETPRNLLLARGGSAKGTEAGTLRHALMSGWCGNRALLYTPILPKWSPNWPDEHTTDGPTGGHREVIL